MDDSQAESRRKRFMSTGFRPTIMCRFFSMQSGCTKGEECTYAHFTDELPIGEEVAKCRFFSTKSGCTNGRACTFAHVTGEFPSGEDVAKRNRFENCLKPCKLCKRWLYDPASCKEGATCKLAHGLDEIGLNNDVRFISILVGSNAEASVQALDDIEGDS